MCKQPLERKICREGTLGSIFRVVFRTNMNYSASCFHAILKATELNEAAQALCFRLLPSGNAGTKRAESGSSKKG